MNVYGDGFGGSRAGDDRQGRGSQLDDVPMVDLSPLDRKLFDQVTRRLWVLRLTRGRLATLPTRGLVLPWLAGSGLLVVFAALGTLPVVVPFAGFVVAVASIAEFTKSEVAGTLWLHTRALLGVEADR